MQPPTYREIIRRLFSEGFAEAKSNGDHRRFRKGPLRVTVRNQGNDHPSWQEWGYIRRQAGWL